MSVKKYVLLKDLPDSKAGDIYEWREDDGAYYNGGWPWESYWQKEYVENNPEWFRPIHEQPKVVFVRFGKSVGDYYYNEFGTSCEIESSKEDAIKQAIEQVLDGDGNIYTIKDLEDAFMKAREIYYREIFEGNRKRWRYRTFQDYFKNRKH